jgi:hypothetical protein
MMTHPLPHEKRRYSMRKSHSQTCGPGCNKGGAKRGPLGQVAALWGGWGAPLLGSLVPSPCALFISNVSWRCPYVRSHCLPLLLQDQGPEAKALLTLPDLLGRWDRPELAHVQRCPNPRTFCLLSQRKMKSQAPSAKGMKDWSPDCCKPRDPIWIITKARWLVV